MPGNLNELLKKRKPEIVVISDVHLGAFQCHSNELLQYLNSIKPKKLILNGDIIDLWQVSRSYFPKSHIEVIKKILDLNSKGTEVIYITGNHDEMLRKFSDISLGTISVVDKLVLDLDGKKAWFFHGDIFDVSVLKAKWIAKLGDPGYDLLRVLNRTLNWFLLKTGKKKYSLSKRIRKNVKGAHNLISDFERAAAELATEQGYKYVVCGHIHQPKMLRKVVRNSTCLYLNSGDWTENLTALEYQDKKWSLVDHSELEFEMERPPYTVATAVI